MVACACAGAAFGFALPSCGERDAWACEQHGPYDELAYDAATDRHYWKRAP